MLSKEETRWLAGFALFIGAANAYSGATVFGITDWLMFIKLWLALSAFIFTAPAAVVVAWRCLMRPRQSVD